MKVIETSVFNDAASASSTGFLIPIAVWTLQDDSKCMDTHFGAFGPWMNSRARSLLENWISYLVKILST